jgi:hypothetical protein
MLTSLGDYPFGRLRSLVGSLALLLLLLLLWLLLLLLMLLVLLVLLVLLLLLLLMLWLWCSPALYVYLDLPVSRPFFYSPHLAKSVELMMTCI